MNDEGEPLMSDQASDSSLIVHRSSLLPVPAPRCGAIHVRLATLADIPFIDELQKKHQKMLGWTPRKTIEGKIAAGHVLVAEGRTEDSGLRTESMHSTQSSVLSTQSSQL